MLNIFKNLGNNPCSLSEWYEARNYTLWSNERFFTTKCAVLIVISVPATNGVMSVSIKTAAARAWSVKWQVLQNYFVFIRRDINWEVPLILYLDSRWKLVAGFTSRSLYPWLKCHRYPINRKMAGTQNRPGRFEEEESLQPLPGIEPRYLCRLSRSPVTMLSTLSRLPKFGFIFVYIFIFYSLSRLMYSFHLHLVFL